MAYTAGNSVDGVADPPVTFVLTVVNGSGDGDYAAGTPVGISADPPAEGMAFDRWTGAAVADETSAATTLTMPAASTVVIATHASVAPPPFAVASLSGRLSPVAGKDRCGLSGSTPWAGALSGLDGATAELTVGGGPSRSPSARRAARHRRSAR